MVSTLFFSFTERKVTIITMSRRGLGCKKPDPEKLKKIPTHKKLSADVIIPSSVDLTPSLLGVRDQGSSPECVPFATACMKEYQNARDASISFYMSPQFIWDNRPDPPANPDGMILNDALDFIQDSGDCFESSYPFDPNSPYTGSYNDESASEINTQAANYKISSYAFLPTYEDLQQAVATTGVCIITFPVYNYGSTPWVQENGQTEIGGHAMAVVGYNNTTQSFLLRNSWGSSWNANGYTNMPYTDYHLTWGAFSSVDLLGSKTIPPPQPNNVIPDYDSSGCCSCIII